MSIDPYTICPGGCNKKIKFCCGKDVSVQLDKIITALSGEQRLSALDMSNSAIEEFGNKPCLMAIKTNIQFQLAEWDQARVTLKMFLEEHPTNNVALAMDIISRLQAGETDKLNQIVEQLQLCMENLGDVAVSAVLEAIRRVGLALYSTGRLTAARAHLSLYNGFLEEGDPEVSRILMQTHSSKDLPLMLRHDHPIRRCEEDVEWKDDFNKVIESTALGRWLSAIEELTDMDKKFPNQPLIARTIAILESRMGDPGEMAAAWSQYADTDGAPLDLAVEAEALSQLIDPAIDEKSVEVLEVTYPIADFEKLAELLVTSKSIERLDIDLTRVVPDGPPPKGAYLLLDREMPESAEGLTVDNVPDLVGQMMLFGKQTDRDARLLIIMNRDDKYDANCKTLIDLAGDLLDADKRSEEVVDRVPRLTHALTWNWRFPKDTPEDLRQRLLTERRDNILREVWPDLPLDELDDKTAREASKLEEYQIPVLGAILLLEVTDSAAEAEQIDLNPLRKELGLPTRDMIDPTTRDGIGSLTLVQIEKLDIGKLTDDQLLEVFNFVGLCRADRSLQAICNEILQRNLADEHEDVDAGPIHSILAQLETDADKAFDHIHKARDLTIDAGEPVGQLLVSELAMRLERGHMDQAASLMKEIETRHMKEQGVAQHLMQVLMRFGIIGPDGRPRGPMPGGSPAGELESVGATADSGLWTPDSGGSPAGDASSGESKLWVPGQE